MKHFIRALFDTCVLLVSFELKTAVEALTGETVGRLDVSSFESSSCIALESLNRMALGSFSIKVVESLYWRGLRILRGRRAELQLLGEAIQVEPLQKQLRKSKTIYPQKIALSLWQHTVYQFTSSAQDASTKSTSLEPSMMGRPTEPQNEN